MFSQVEIEYLKGLVNVYRSKGYNYYLAHTITDNSSINDYDMCVYFSKEKIESVTDNYFEVRNGIQLYVDSSSKGSYNTNASDKVSSFSKHIEIDPAEFIFTNAISEFSYTSTCLNPDIALDYSYNHTSIITTCLIAIIFGYIVVRDLFLRGN